MTPEVLEIFEAATKHGDSFMVRELSGAQHFAPSPNLFRDTCRIAQHEMQCAMEHGELLVAPMTSRLPATTATITVNGVVFFVRVEDSGHVVVFHVDRNFDGASYGAFLPGGFVEIDPRWNDGDEATSTVFHTAILLSLINTPGKVTAKPARGLQMSRQHRRRLERSGAPAGCGFFTLDWVVGQSKKTGANSADETGTMPLHFVRGYFRKCDAEKAGAVLISCEGWKEWIDGHWRGCPSNGIKLKDQYKPRTLGEERALIEKAAALGSIKAQALIACRAAALEGAAK